jgi:outer membrane protein
VIGGVVTWEFEMKIILMGSILEPVVIAVATTGARLLTAKPGLQNTVLSALIGLCLAGTAQASDLTYLLQSTLGNPAIAASKLQSQAAAEDARASTLRYFGQANVFTEHNRYDAARVVGIFTPGVTPLPAPVSQGITQYGVNYHLPVDVFGIIAAERKQAQANSTTAQLLERQEILLRLHQTLAAYVRLQALANQGQALKAEQMQLEEYANRVREEIKVGRTAQLDLSLVQSDLARLAAQQTVFDGNRHTALAALAASANVSDPSISATIIVPVLQKNDTQSPLPVALAQEQQTAADEAAQKAHRSLFPTFSVDSQYTNYDASGMQRHDWAVGLGMNIPLDPAAMQHSSAAMQRAQAARDQSLAVQADTHSQISALEADYWSAIGNSKALATEVEHRKEVVAVEREKWKLGAGTMDTLLYQERNLLEAQYALADSRAHASIAWSGMQMLLGTPSAQYINSLEARL